MLGLALSAGAALAPAAAPAAPAAAPAAGAGADVIRVTLLTGDTVAYAARPGGRFTVALTPPPDSGPRPPGVPFTSEQVRGPDGRQHLYVYPSGVLPLVRAGRVDRTLFDVTELTRERLSDAASATLPVLVASAGRQPAALPAATRTAAPATAAGTAMLVDRHAAAAFWRAVAPDTRTLAGGVTAVRLDRRFAVADDASDRQVGAPAAWAKGLTGAGVTIGVIDTGIDAGHPDLAGRVTQARDFTSSGDTSDTIGHGTHVASIAAGTGVASGGAYRGVAPDARLLSAKVCASAEDCPESAILAAMDWVTGQGARVVNMSLGGPVSDDDPVVAAVNTLSARTGALFVVAAGNDGPAAMTVSSPGDADAALTVGAVDRSDKLAPFSSRGPRLADGAVKPEITAPGVGIVAARAAGTSMGDPVDDHYTRASGTSMATPHVAGAAAILAQQHPSDTGAALKAGLAAAAADLRLSPYQQGDGRLDLARSTAQPGTADATVTAGAPTGPETRQVHYANAGTAPLTLSVATGVTGWNGRPAPANLVRTAARAVTVPAGGTATLDVRIDPSGAPPGVYQGTVTATGGGTTLRTAIGLDVPAPQHTLTLHLTDSTGRPATGTVSLIKQSYDATHGNDPYDAEHALQDVPVVDGTGSIRTTDGGYLAVDGLFENGLAHRRYTALARPNITLNRDTAVTLDARTAVPTGVTADRPTEQRDHELVLTAQTPDAGAVIPFAAGQNAVDTYATPVPPASRGQVGLQDDWSLDQPLLRVDGLHPAYDAYPASKAFTGTRTLPVVHADNGDFTGVDARGRLALVRLTVPPGSADPVGDARAAAATAAGNAVKAGAAAVLPYVDSPGALPLIGLDSGAVPQLALSAAEGDALHARAGATLTLHGLPNPAYRYTLAYPYRNGIPASLTHPRSGALTAIDSTYHADKPGLTMLHWWYGSADGLSSAFLNPRTYYPAPARWTDYVGPVDRTVYWNRFAQLSTADTTGVLAMWGRTYLTSARPSTEDWFAGPSLLGATDGGHEYSRVTPNPLDGSGGTDLFVPSGTMVDGTPGHQLDIDYGDDYPGHVRWTLSAGGTTLPPVSIPGSNVPGWALPPAAAGYTLTSTLTLPAGSHWMPSLAVTGLGTRVDTAWSFRSAHTAGTPCVFYDDTHCARQPLIQFRYRPNLDPANRAPAGRPVTVEADAAAPAGAAGAGQVTTLTAQASTDDGTTWSTAAVRPLGGGRFAVTVNDPASGFVSLRLSARDTAGDTATQTVVRAYAVGG